MAMPAPLRLDAGYACVVGHESGEGPVLRNKMSAARLTDRPLGSPELQNIYELFSKSGLQLRPHSPCFGSRVREDGSVGPYSWQTYAEVSARIDALAAALWKLEMVGLTADGFRFLALYCKNSRDWMVAAEACFKTGVVVVPMYDTLGASVVSYIQAQTGCLTVVCTEAELLKMLPPHSCPFKDVVVCGPLAESTKAQSKQAGVRVHRLAELEAFGAADAAALRGVKSPGYDDIALICYTSGTTGDPKGAMISHGNVLGALGMSDHPEFPVFNFDVAKPQEVHLSYLPLAHIYETVIMHTAIYGGAAIGFYQGDTLKILDDLGELRPTIFVSVPRLYNRIYDKILAGVAAKSAVAKALFARGMRAKLQQIERGGGYTHALWDKLIFGKVQAQLGLDRCHTMTCGSAPISAEVKDFMRAVLGGRFLEGYGLTETCASCTLAHPDDATNHHVGMVSTSAELKLVDVPDMNYFSTSVPPCGEVCVRGPVVFKGYYKMADKTAEAIDADGWFHTGDVGSLTATGCLRIIDRKKNIFKLAQGEYVAAEKIETICGRCPLIAQIFVYGDSLQSYLVAAVVPDAEETAKWAEAQGLGGTSLRQLTEGAAGDKLHAALLAQIKAAAAEAKLAGFEIVKQLVIDPEPWSVENNLLTPTFKMKRVDLKKRYKAQFDALYQVGAGAGPSKL